MDRALMRPRPDEQPAHLAQVVVDDRLAAVEPQQLDQLPDTDTGQPRITLQQPWISSLNGSSFDGRPGHLNVGGRDERNAEPIVLRASPVRRTSSLIDTPRTNCSRRNSAQRSTSSTPPPGSRSR
jgi:hypothetical protein